MYGTGLQDLFAGRDSDDASAAARNVAEVFVLLRAALTDEK